MGMEAKMAEYERSQETAASPEVVWRIWSDPLTWNEWNPDIARVALDKPLAVGTTGEMFMKSGKHHDIRFEAIQPGREFQLLATRTIPGHPFIFRCEVAPVGSGSRITQAVRITGPLAGILGPMMGDSVAKTFLPILAALAEKAESGK